ncbi:MAG: hypothetical protein LKE52_04460 [Bacilli bacterium]|nr:hypothetical protein [Bacilli bacterium]
MNKNNERRLMAFLNDHLAKVGKSISPSSMPSEKSRRESARRRFFPS